MFYSEEVSKGTGILDPEESRHCIKVLRKKMGDTIQVTNGKGTLYQASIENDDFKKCQFRVTSEEKIDPYRYYTHIAVAPTKNSGRMEFLVEKATEAGVSEISFVQCEHSERKKLNIERLQKVAISAMKQSGRLILPKINGLERLSSFLERVSNDKNKFIAYVESDNASLFPDLIARSDQNTILIGPEGDFSKKEVEMAEKHNFKQVSLGKYVLRTETAALFAVFSISALNMSNT